MSYMLPHLDSGYAVDQAILSEEDRVVIIRFGHDWDPVCNSAFESWGHASNFLNSGLHENGRDSFPHCRQD